MDHILSLSYGKDSMACLGALDILGWPLTRIVTSDVWATDTIPAELPPMVAWKATADAIIKERWGIKVEHVRGKYSYQDCFYMVCGAKSKYAGNIYGWPFQRGPWCNSRLKQHVLGRNLQGCVQYLGIADDEPNRFHTLSETKKSPLVELGWTEADCRRWCEENSLLSPLYTTETRGGCWFCHNQGVGQLRRLRKNYPGYRALMLKWDADSPVTFKPGKCRRDGTYEPGHTIHDYDRRFALEDQGIIIPDKPFRWELLDDNIQLYLEKEVRPCAG